MISLDYLRGAVNWTILVPTVILAGHVAYRLITRGYRGNR